MGSGFGENYVDVDPRRAVSAVEADHSDGEESSATISTLPHLEPELFIVLLLELGSGGDEDLVELGLELGFIDVTVAEFAEGGFRFLLSSLCA